MNIKALFKSLLLRKFAVTLLVLQLALTLALIVNSTILALDTAEKINKPMGIDLKNTLVIQVVPTSGVFKNDDYAKSIIKEDLHKITQLPGVISAAPTLQLPIQNGGTNGNVYDLDDPEKVQVDKYLRYVPFFMSSPEFQEVLDLEIVEGRFLTDSDMYQEGDESINVVITESLKNSLYGSETALGQETNNGIVVGVVKDINISPNKPANKQYGILRPYIWHGSSYYMIKVEPGQEASVRAALTDTILGVQAERDILDIFTMEEHLLEFYGHDRGLANLFTMLCILMLVVTVISSYANAQFHVSKQKKLIGIRRALGATRKDVLVYVLSENWLIYLLGSLLGIAAIFATNVFLSEHLDISKPDVLMFLGAIAVVFLSGTLATWLPAYKTSRIPPVIATRTI